MWLCATALFIVSLGYGVIIPQLPALIDDTFGREGALAMILFCYATSKIVAQVPGGVLADRHGGRRMLILGTVLFTLSLLPFCLTDNAIVLAIARTLEGAATGLVYPASGVVVATGDPATTGRRVGTIGAVGTAGLLVGPGLAAAFSESHGPRFVIWLAFGVSALVSVLLLVRRLPEGNVKEPTTLREEVAHIKTALVDVWLVALMLPVFFNKMTYTAFQGLLPVYGKDAFAWDTRTVSLLFLGMGVLFGVAQGIGGFLADRVRPARTILVFGLALAGVLAAMAILPGPAAFAGTFLAYVLVASIVFALALKAVADHSGEGRYGTTFGVYGTLTDVATVVGPPLFLGLYAGYAQTVYGIMAAVCAGFYLVYALLTKGGSGGPRR